MQTPVVVKYCSSLSPWDLYRYLYAHFRVSFFLDSPDYSPPNQTYSYIGVDPFLEVQVRAGRVRLSGERNGIYPAGRLFSILRNLFRVYRNTSKWPHSFFAGGAVGYWGYESAVLFEKIRFRRKPGLKIPEIFLGFYREYIVYDHYQRVYYLVAYPKSQKTSPTSIERLKQFFRDAESALSRTSAGFHLKHFRPDIKKKNFKKIVQRAKTYIRDGDIYQANLSQRFQFDFQGSSLKLYEALREINPSPFACFLKIRDFEIISSSPERLVQKRGRHCETLPIAGTRPRRSAGKNEQELMRELASNKKERAEHIMLVDLERNDLGRVCDWPSVRVKEMMRVEKYSHVLHLVSQITGRLKKGKDAFDLIRAMFPGGTITGCPKIRCMQIIDELEPVRRGVYTGSIGYIDYRGDMDLNIVIRTLLLYKGKGYLQVGAGIVNDSDPEKEYEETLHKGEALTEALAQASLEPVRS